MFPPITLDPKTLANSDGFSDLWSARLCCSKAWAEFVYNSFSTPNGIRIVIKDKIL